MSEGRLPDDEHTFTIRPPPRCAIRGAATRISRIGAITCSSHWACQSPSSSSSAAPWPRSCRRCSPARRWRRSAARTRPRSARRRPGSVTSAWKPSPRETPSTRAPSRSSSFAVGRADAAARAGHHARLAGQAQVHVGIMPGHDSHTVYKTFNTAERREFVRITEDVQAAVDESGIAEGMALVSRHAHHRGRLDQRRRARHPGGRAGVARQARPAVVEGARERHGRGAAPRPGRLPPPPRRRGQRRRPPEEPAGPPPGDRARDRRPARPRARGRRSSTASSTAGATSGW